MTKYDGALIDSVRYRAFGSERWSSGNVDRPRSFTGHVNDTQSGLLYMGARHYDTETGTFLTFDPAGQYPSPYAYGGNNPFAGTDPTGASFEISGSFSFDGMEATGFGEFFKSGDLGANLGAAMRLAQVAARKTSQRSVVNGAAPSAPSTSIAVIEAAAGNPDSVVGGGIAAPLHRHAHLAESGREVLRLCGSASRLWSSCLA